MTAKAKEPKSELSFIAEALQRSKRALYYVLIFSLCSNLLLLALPIYSLQVLDRVISSASVPTLIYMTVIVIFAFIFYGIFNLVRNFILNQIGEWIDTQVSSRLLSIGVQQNSIGSPTLASQHLRDLQSIKAFISGNGITSLFDAPWSIIYIIVIYMINPALGLVSVVGGILLLGFAILNEVLTRKPQAVASRLQIKTMEIADTCSRNAEAIEAMGMMANVREHWGKENARAQQFLTKATSRSNILLNTSRVFRMLLQIAIIGIGGYLAIQNEISLGGMIAASILTGRALAPFEAAIGIWKGLTSARDSYNRIEKAVANFPQLRGDMELPDPKGDLSVENAFFAAGGTKAILKNVNFKLAPGEMLGIIGPSAAGKSTLAKLIVGILPPTQGAVRLDGAEIFKWNRDYLGKHVGYMPQNVDLFPGTVMENIARMEAEPDQKKVIEAAQAACVHEMILRLSEGYETVIRPGNSTLSPGQRQRIGLARALYGRPSFLVLDEPNINLDGEGEQALIKALMQIKGMGITTVIVAHRPNLVNNTDKIAILQNGTLKEFGPTRQILGKYVSPSISEAGA
ncbi:MAG: type I secretion system permease/ATPase [Alphaproteobacteria bacterium]|nr:type I secretion system permease/ATPase [Alphaproteobacteria bacterium]